MFVFLMLDNGGTPRTNDDLRKWLVDVEGAKKDLKTSGPVTRSMFTQLAGDAVALNLPMVKTRIFGGANITKLMRQVYMSGNYGIHVKGKTLIALRLWKDG